MFNELRVSNAIKLLDEAYEKHQSIEPLTVREPKLTIDDAYTIQMKRIEVAIKSGDRITGKKIGLTSIAMQNLLGVNQPDYGHLLESMYVENGTSISLSKFFQPKIEGEIAFILKEDLVGPNVNVDDVLRATDYILPALEFVDSRIKDWKIQIEDTVADNASSGLYILGTNKMKVSDIDLKTIKMQLIKDGEIFNEGKGTDVLGNPVLCVAWLANKLHEYGVTLKAGEIVLSGALSAAAVAVPGSNFVAKFTGLGEVNIHFIE